MAVPMTPELEKRMNDLAAKTGLAPERLLEAALIGYDAGRVAALDWSRCPAVRAASSASVRAMRYSSKRHDGSRRGIRLTSCVSAAAAHDRTGRRRLQTLVRPRVRQISQRRKVVRNLRSG